MRKRGAWTRAGGTGCEEGGEESAARGGVRPFFLSLEVFLGAGSAEALDLGEEVAAMAAGSAEGRDAAGIGPLAEGGLADAEELRRLPNR
jgi:hypothetical protein